MAHAATGFIFQNHHLCCVIAKMMPQLRHVKLWIGMVCYELFGKEANDRCRVELDCDQQNHLHSQHTVLSNIETFIVDATYRMLLESQCLPLAGSIGAPASTLVREAKREFLHVARAAVLSKWLPSVRRFSVFDIAESDGYDTFDAIIEKDMLSYQSHSFPLISNEDVQMTRFKTPEGVQIEALGDRKELIKAITGPVWEETIHGSRFPAGSREWRPFSVPGHQCKHQDIQVGEKVSQNFEMRWHTPLIRLLRLEKRFDRSLLNCQTTQGIFETNPLRLDDHEFVDENEIWSEESFG